MKVSIIIPVYNRNELLQHTLDSVKSQTFDDYEVIVVDDGSTTEIEVPEWVKLIRLEDNSGASAVPRNEGMKVAKGEYFVFLDSDDIWEPTFLEKCVNVIEMTDVDIVYSGIYEDGKPNHPRKTDMWPDMLGECYSSVSGSLIRSKCLEGKEWDEGLHWSMWIRLAKECTYFFTPESLVHYGRNDNQLSKKRDYTRILFVLNKYREEYEKYPKMKTKCFYLLGMKRREYSVIDYIKYCLPYMIKYNHHLMAWYHFMVILISPKLNNYINRLFT
jgi:glycosyltransferase involved in cell wall biosynthesis